MKKGTKIFTVVTSIILALTVAWTVILTTEVYDLYKANKDDSFYGIILAGVKVTSKNQDDILGDGTASYNEINQVLMLENAEIVYDKEAADDGVSAIIYSLIDLTVLLTGENKFIVNAGDYVPAVYAANYLLSKDIVFTGGGSLSIEYQSSPANAMGIYGEDVTVEADVTLTMLGGEGISNGVYVEGVLTVRNGATLTVNNGAAKYSCGVKSRGNCYIEKNSALNINITGGTTDDCKGLNVGGSLVILEDSSVSVSVDEAASIKKECVNVCGLISLGANASLTASSKSVYSIECFGSIELSAGATISASTENSDTDAICYGSVANFGATINGNIEALNGVFNKSND